ncbi:MAG: sensor hybrid histidine kinase [Chloroflexi bacterium]|nr:sensor hybrid histidine kinase [Chloroflexota bacterium]
MAVIGQERILLMDDEPAIRDSVGEMLECLGYEVVVVREGKEAIEAYRQALEAGKPFDAVLLDLTIVGGMNGKDTIRKLLELDPKIKAVASSGYSEDLIMANHSRYGFRAVLTKPYTLKELEQALREAF